MVLAFTFQGFCGEILQATEYSWHFFSQGYKRLKKHQTEGRLGPLSSSDRSMADDVTHSSNANSIHSKEALDYPLRDKSARSGTVPISIKSKKGDNASSKQNENKRDENFDYGLGKTVGEPPPIEIGPKRLKVKTLQFLSLEEELNSS